MHDDPCRVLIVEDDRAIARVLERNLQREGLRVQVACDGRSAVEALSSATFDFILCDYQLPDTTGDELCRRIRAGLQHPQVAIALCTAKAHEFDRQSLIAELNLADIFMKPFSLREITSAISEAAQSTRLVAGR